MGATCFSLEKRVSDMMRKAFWDILQEKLNEDPPDYSHALQLLEEMKQVSELWKCPVFYCLIRLLIFVY